MSESSLYTYWECTIDQPTISLVFPDGCRDILLLPDDDSGKKLLLTDWDDRVRHVPLEKGDWIAGFRLRPGLSVCIDELSHIDTAEDGLRCFIESQLEAHRETCELVDELSDTDATLQQLAKQTGVSTRTLQRRFKSAGFPKPEYWMMLSRVRSAATRLAGEDSLAAVASDCGFSDQAHLTRECVRWFGCPPSVLRSDKSLLDDICQPGLGNWTAEQISIK